MANKELASFNYDPLDGTLGVFIKLGSTDSALEVLGAIRSLVAGEARSVSPEAGKKDGVPEVVYPVEHGVVEANGLKIRVVQVSLGSWKAEAGRGWCVGKTKEEAVNRVISFDQEQVAKASVEKPEKAPAQPGLIPSAAVEAPREKVEAKPALPPIDEKNVPAALLGVSTIRQVMAWMLAKDGGGYEITDIDGIAARCDQLKPHVPVLARMAGVTRDRVERALSIVAQNAAAT